MADISTIISVMSGSADVSSASADVNGDGAVDVADISTVISIMASSARLGTTSVPARFAVGAGPVPARLTATANAVTMSFHPGDILRFEGMSGKMKTIMHIAPESSHPVTFDFFRCEDKDGYNYPIVRAGDMMWMLEDLHPLTMQGLIKTSDDDIFDTSVPRS